jgi:hypothetical protein
VKFRKWCDSHRGRRDERSTNAGLQRQSPGQAICYINKFDPVCLHHRALIQVGFYGSVLTYAGRTKQLCLNGDVQSVKAGSLSRCCARHLRLGAHCRSTVLHRHLFGGMKLNRCDTKATCPTALEKAETQGGHGVLGCQSTTTSRRL